jgi:radical SAM superfamily enzyme YgiQ (UPF0313 family)
VVKNPGLFEQWREVGLEYAAVGLEAANDAYLSSLGKDCTVAQNNEAIAILRQCGIMLIGQFMVGTDFDERDFDELEAYVLRRGIHYPSFSIATPFPGTPMAQKRRGEMSTSDYRKFDCMHAVVKTKLPLDLFYRRYMQLYGRSYGLGRVLGSLRDRIDPRPRAGAASPLLLAAVHLQTRLSWRKLRREYGIE